MAVLMDPQPAHWRAKMKRSAVLSLLGVLAIGGASLSAAAQTTPPAAGTALDQCRQAVRYGREADGRAATSRAEGEYRRALADRRDDVEARVLLARVLVECRIPQAGPLAQARLIGQSNTLLEEALARDSIHWEARFSLAMNHFHTPEFLGRTGDAVREFERLVAQQGDRADMPWFAESHLYLGDLHLRRNRKQDAIDAWRRGADLFPEHAGLRERLRVHAVPSAAASGGDVQQADETTVSPTFSLQGIVVAASGSRVDDPRSGVALRRLDVVTTPGGAADLMQALRTGPGATGATEGSDLYVRGGDPAEAPVWIDGARIFYPGRYETMHGAIFGVLDPSVMQSAFFSSGGFSARYGNALSGVLDVQTEDRPADSVAQIAINLVQAGVGLQTPLGPRTGAWGSLRATHGGAMLALHGRGDEFATAPRALEGIGGFIWEPSASSMLKATAMVDGDRSSRFVEAYGHAGAFESTGENRLIGLSGRFVGGGGRTILRGSVSGSSRSTSFTFGVLDHQRSDVGAAARLDGEFELHHRSRLRMGAEVGTLFARTEGVVPLTEQLGPGSSTVDRHEEDSTSQIGGYIENEVALLPRLALVGGFRTDRLPGETVATVDPRIAVAFQARPEWTLRVGGGVFHQGRWRTRYFVPDPNTPSGVPRRATHLVAGAERQGEPALKVEAYLKEYGAYAPLGDGPGITAGRATGADAILRWTRQPKLNGWLTYSLLRGRLELEDGASVPSAVDVTHTLTAVGKLALPHGLELGTTGRFASGRPFTRPGMPIHSERLPNYTRLDARLTRFWSLRSGMLVSYLELLNALDRENVTAYTFDSSGEARAIPAFFRRTAVLGLSLSF
jgi:vitamin B12 transporter